MARIPGTELQRLKDEVAVQRLIEDAGAELKRGGKDFTGKCPFHADDTASLVVTPTKNLWHCFGCGVGGGPIDWVIKSRGVSFRHAVELLREGLPASSLAAGVNAAGVSKRSTVRLAPLPSPKVRTISRSVTWAGASAAGPVGTTAAGNATVAGSATAPAAKEEASSGNAVAIVLVAACARSMRPTGTFNAQTPMKPSCPCADAHRLRWAPVCLRA